MKKKQKIIGLCGRMRSGKTMLATSTTYEYTGNVITIAAPLKSLVGDILGLDYYGVNDSKDKLEPLYRFSLCHDEYINKIATATDIDPKKILEICDEYENRDSTFVWTVRELLQFIGTNIIRVYHPTWHIEQMTNTIKNLKDEKYIVVDDIRFPNEKKAIEDLGGECFFCVRPLAREIKNHESETSLTWDMFDNKHILINDSLKEDTIKLWLKYVEDDFRYGAENYLTLDANHCYFDENVNFGKEKTPFVEELLRQTARTELFVENGLITFEGKNTAENFQFCQEVLNKVSGKKLSGHHYILYNPIIFENLKRWL